MTKPFRIALINQYDQGWVAGTEYLKNIILALSTLSLENQHHVEINLITSKSIDNSILNLVAPRLKEIFYTEELFGSQTLLKIAKRKMANVLLKRPYYNYENFLRKASFDFVYPYFSPHNDEVSSKSAALIFDFQHKYLTKYFSKKEIFLRNRYFGYIAKYASTVILSSKCAEKDFHKFFPHAASKSRVLPFRAVPSPEWFEGNPKDVQKKYSLPDKFFIVCNQFWQHKNHRVIFESMNILKKEDVRPVVICTGHKQDYRRQSYFDDLLKSIRRYGLEEQVHIIGLIPRIDQIQLLRRSIAVIQPSLFEGWSTVVEESRCLGIPMILSDIPVHFEQNPSNSQFFDRNSPNSLAGIMANLWKSLHPGPDLDQETIAMRKNKREVRLFAGKFIEISRE